jgi:VanZ family protein
MTCYQKYKFNSLQYIFCIVRFIPPLILFICLFWLGTKPKFVSLFPINPPIDKLVHLVFFGFITALLSFSVLKKYPVIIFIITTMVALTDELHQYYIPGRTASFGDFAADLVGIVIIVVILNYMQHKSAISN